MNLTAKIFELSAPYNNPYQGTAPRVLFVCSAGILRSPTAAALAANEFGWNTRACGVHDHALIPLSVNLILWAHRIVFMENYLLEDAICKFELVDYGSDIKERAIILGIEDDYCYMDVELQNLLRERIEYLVKF